MQQIVCRLGLCPRPTGGAYIAPPEPLAGLGVGPTWNGKEGGEGKGGRGGAEGRDEKGREGSEGRPGMPKSRVGKPRRQRIRQQLLSKFESYSHDNVK